MGRSVTPPERKLGVASHGSPFTISLKDDFDGLPGPGGSASRASAAPVRRTSLRSRRSLTQAIGAGALFIFAGWLFLQPTQLDAVSLMGNEIASIIPGELVLPLTPGKRAPLLPTSAMADATSSTYT